MSDQVPATPMTPQERARLRRARIAQNQGNRMALVTGVVKAESFKEEVPAVVPVSTSNITASSSAPLDSPSKSTLPLTSKPTPAVISDDSRAQSSSTVNTPTKLPEIEPIPVSSTSATSVNSSAFAPVSETQTLSKPIAVASPAFDHSAPRFAPTAPAPASPAAVDAKPTPSMSPEETAARMAFYQRRKTMKKWEPLFRFLLLTLFSIFVGVYSFFADPSHTHPFVQRAADLCPLIVRHPVAFFFFAYVIAELTPVVIRKAYVGRTPGSALAPQIQLSEAEALADILPKGAANLMGSDQMQQLLPYAKYLGYYTAVAGAFKRAYRGIAWTVVVSLVVTALLTAVLSGSQ